VPTKKSFLLRLEVDTLEALRRWADDELRSLNAQVEFILREALRRAGRVKMPLTEPGAAGGRSAAPSDESL
jgi:hypothetical protein